jgi:hypothetical protein
VKEEVRVADGVGSGDAVSILHVKVPEHYLPSTDGTLDAVFVHL